MKILMVISGMTAGGSERVMATLCNSLVCRQSVRLLILKDKRSDYQIDDLVDVVTGNVSYQSPIQSVAAVKRNIDEWKPDVILSFMTKNNIVTLIARSIAHYKVPVCISERANPYFSSPLFKMIRWVLYRFADGCVFQTSKAREYYKDIIKRETIVIPNPLNSDFMKNPFSGIRTKRIVTVGRLSKEKNQEILISAFAKISQKHPEYTLEIYGDGPLREVLQDKIDKLELAGRAKLMGRRDKIQDLIADAEIFVLPSNSEGMPNALMEAMALGLSCIATDCPIGGSADLIEDGNNGLLIPVNDEKALEFALTKMIDDSDFARKCGTNAQYVREKYNAETICEKWELYLRSLT